MQGPTLHARGDAACGVKFSIHVVTAQGCWRESVTRVLRALCTAPSGATGQGRA